LTFLITYFEKLSDRNWDRICPGTSKPFRAFFPIRRGN